MSLTDTVTEMARKIQDPLIRQMNQISSKTSINLGLGQLTWPVDPQIVDAVRAVAPSDFLYGPNQGSAELRKAVSARYGANSAENAVITIGVQEAVYDTVAALKKAGAMRVLIPDIAFGIYQKMATEFGLSIQKFKMTPEFKVDYDSLERELANHADVVFLNFPGNPTGVGITAVEQLALAQFLTKSGKPYVISDEIYRDLTFSGEKPESFASVYENTVVVDGTSKSGAAAGLRVGWAFTNNTDLAKIIGAMGTTVKSCPPTLNQRAALPVVKGLTASTIAEYNSRLAHNFKITAGYLAQIGVHIPQSTGGFYVFPDLGMADTESFCRTLASQENGVTTVPGKIFGRPSHVRISFASDKIAEGMDRFVTAYQTAKQQ